MKTLPVKTMLRSAVIAAIPLATQVGCVNNETVRASDQQPEPGSDPCRSGEARRISAQERFAAQVGLLSSPPSSEQCIAMCKREFENRRVGRFNDLVKLERITASQCVTENRPYTYRPMSRIPVSEPSTMISCKVDYTAIHSPYTCPRPVPGRLPQGLHLPIADHSTGSNNAIGAYLADMAAMETAAITAFRYLSRELAAYGAPADLVARAQAAVAEETRHAEMAGLLSAAYDAEVQEVRVDDFVLRPLYEIALENAVEGCVNETFAAACGLWQSEHAQLDTFRRVMAHISDEETGHAALSWDIHAWIMPQLTQAQQKQILAAQAEAVDKLMSDFRQEADPVLQQAFGLPARDDAARLFTQLQDSVWANVSQERITIPA